MSAEEYELYHYLNRTPGCFVSLYDIAKDLGGRRTFASSREWALECLQRLENEGLVEKNEAGEYRIRHQPGDTEMINKEREKHEKGVFPIQNLPEDTTEFLKAIRSPGVSLGDTAIIRIQDLSP